MHFAVGIGTLLLGGWLINAPPGAQQLEEQPEETVTESAPNAPGPVIPPSRMPQGTGMSSGVSAPPAGAATRRGEPAADEQSRRRMQMGASQPGQFQPGQATQQPAKTGMMTPLNPTETPDDSQATSNLPTAPTMSGAPGMGMPQAPTSRRSTQPPLSAGAGTFPGAQQQLDRGAMMAPREKAFAQARPFSSGVSPWQNLFRNDNAGGTIDNYTTLVRPSFEQQNRNQQFSNDIYGLERSARIQNSQLQQLSRGQPRSLQGIATPQYYMRSGNGNLPQYYMNYGNYYQSGQNAQGYGP